MKIDKREQKILIMGGVVLVVILLFWFFVFAPKNKQMKELRAEYNEIQKDIDQTTSLAGEGKNLDVLLSEYENKRRELHKKFPTQEEATLRELAREAVGMGIEVLSISPQRAVDCQLPVNVEGYRCKELNISMKLFTSYKKLGEYLGLLEEEFPFNVRLKEVYIVKKGEDKGISRLEASIELVLYMLIPA